MKSKFTTLLKLSGILAIIIFILLFLINLPKSINEIWNILIESAGYSTIICLLYEKYLWKYNPFVKIPRLKKKYKGKLKYTYNNESREKSVIVKFKQTLLSTKVKLQSNEIRSNTLTSEMIKENDEFVLYYTYITNPSSEYSDKNPIQIGTCKLVIDNVTNFSGIYWTNRKTIGDLSLSYSKN